MKVALLDAKQGNRNPANSITVAYRNMLVLKDSLGADFFTDATKLETAGCDYDVIICGFGSTSTEREQSVAFLQRNQDAKLFWLVGEYEQSTFAPLFYSKRKFDVIKNFQHSMNGKMISDQHFININALLADSAPEEEMVDRSYGAIYYGRWRPDRGIYVSKYLQHGVALSTSPKNMKVFSHAGCKPDYMRPLSWKTGRETLGLFSASLYIEDMFTHKKYNCPGNRYYEAIKCGVPILTQPEAMNTWETFGLDIGPRRVVSSHSELVRVAESLKNDSGMMADYLQEQQEWGARALKEKDDVLGSIKDIIGGN